MKAAWFARAVAAALVMSSACAATAVRAAELPTPAALGAQLGPRIGQAVTVAVLEPHLKHEGHMPEVRYVGYPADAVLTALFGPGWRSPGQELTFRALDGFMSRIPVERFAQHRAWLVHARADGRPFQVDNDQPGGKPVPLGPFYLVWDNRSSTALQAEGGMQWPYQVVSVDVGPSSTHALLPAGLAATYADAAALARTHCLSCHRIRGYGGDKMPLELDVMVRGYDRATWRRWLLEPASVRPGTAMPPLAEGLPAPERAAIAQRLYDYLQTLSALPAR
ncbi:hypothetical protein ACQ86G_05850 [Roseateles chitinivorans]|uniref:hypothetical protein n=1 Tax=Roseateles chitinivorans TaxID=2917965 RepID=UPI003D671585